MSDVLVLNASFEPLCVIDLGRAVTLVLDGRADLVESTGALLRSPSVELETPSVIRLVRYAKVPRTGVPVTRRAVLALYGHVCAYCRVNRATSVDHVIPRSRMSGPANVWGNVVAACQSSSRRKPGCNGMKGDRLLSELGWPPVKPLVPTRAQVLAALHRHRPGWEPYLVA